MKIATYNCNSIRQRLPIVLEALAEHEFDVLALQETKVDDATFPREDIEDMGWHLAIHGQRGYNGVALISRHPIENLQIGFGDPLMPDDCRLMAAEIQGMRVVNTYVPNGNKVGSDKFAYKLAWLERYKRFLIDWRPDVWVGYITIAPASDDVYDSKVVYGGVGHHPAEFERLAALTELGYEDMFRKFTQGIGHYTFWVFFIKTAFERNNGWRIDHIYALGEAASRCTSCVIDVEPRRHEKPSDHTIVWAQF